MFGQKVKKKKKFLTYTNNALSSQQGWGGAPCLRRGVGAPRGAACAPVVGPGGHRATGGAYLEMIIYNYLFMNIYLLNF